MRLCGLQTRRQTWLAVVFIGAMGVALNSGHAQQPAPALVAPEQPGEDRASHPTRAPRVEAKTVSTTPAAEPQPALEYRFWPAWHELEPGNSVPLYLRAIVQLSGPGDQERWRTYEELMEAQPPDPSDPEAMEAAREWLNRYGSKWVFEEIRRATYREEADFGHRIESLQGTQQFSFLLPELHELRELARLLDIRIRIAIADGDFDEAIASLRDGFRLAGTLRESRLLISQLVGAAIVRIMLEDVRLLISAPGAPNLYWALASLPRPLISMPYTIAFEVDLAERLLPQRLNEPAGVEAWNEYLIETIGDAYQFISDTGRDQPWERRMMITAGVMQAYPQAKAALIAEGVPEATVEAMPVVEVIVRHMRRQLRTAGDDLQKWLYLPPEVQQLTKASREDPVDKILKQHQAKYDPVRIMVELLPAIPVAASIKSRIQAQLDALITIEAMRAYAAAHDGQLPEHLDQLEPLPALLDPRTGEPFDWERQSGETPSAGVLRLADLMQPGVTFEYHVRICPAAP